jgi:flagellar hook-length control protein FliK
LPPAAQQAIAATIAPAPQAVVEIAQRLAKTATGGIEIKAAPEANTARTAPVSQSAPAKPQTVKAATTAKIIPVAAAAPQMTIDAPEAGQSAQTSAISAATTQASGQTQHAAADAGAQRAAPAAAQVAREIIRRFDGGNTSFELRLDPPELGRVEVRMEVSRDHRVTAVISADSPQALTELARHARELEAQLQSAGLQLSDNGLSFDLRQGASGRGAQDADGAKGAAGGEETLAEQQTAPVARPIGIERWRGVRVDMMV